MQAAAIRAGSLIEEDDAIFPFSEARRRRTDQTFAPKRAQARKDRRARISPIADILRNVELLTRNRCTEQIVDKKNIRIGHEGNPGN